MRSRLWKSSSSAVLSIALVSVGLGFLSALPARADITGTVFADLNANGVQDGGEVGVGGIEVSAFDAANSQLGATATTLASGLYTLTGLGGAQVRLELSIPAAQGFLKTGGSLTADGNTAVVFATDPATGVSFAVSEPGEFCQADPALAASCYIEFEQSTNTEDVVITFPFNAGCDNFNGDGDCTDVGEVGAFDTPAPTHVASAQETGTTWGLAYQPVEDTLYAAAFMKRHSGFRAFGETGVIYQIENASTGVTTVSPYVDFDALGIDTGTDTHPQTTDTCTSAANANNDNDNCWFHDASSWDAVGKIGFGDLEISHDLTALWTINLFDRRLYRVPLQANPLVLADITSFATPVPGDCVAGDVRPFALGFHREEVWVGMVCSAESTVPGGFTGGEVTAGTAPGTQANLRAYVYSFDGATFTQQVNFQLDYARGCLFGTQPATCAGFAHWQPWVSVFTFLDLSGSERGYPQPMLSDIEFDNGSMILGFRDRSGDQFGFQQLSTDVTSATLHTGDSAGEIIRLCASGGGFVLEGSPGCASNVVNGQGPGGGEYYAEDGWFSPNFFHQETTMGGLAQVPGVAEVVTALYDPYNADASAFSGGIGRGLLDRRLDRRLFLRQGQRPGRCRGLLPRGSTGDRQPVVGRQQQQRHSRSSRSGDPQYLDPTVGRRQRERHILTSRRDGDRRRRQLHFWWADQRRHAGGRGGGAQHLLPGAHRSE